MRAKHLIIFVIGITASMSAIAADTLFEFDGGIGSQPLRAVPAGGTVPAVNTVAGVNPGGAPWPIASLKAEIKIDGSIRLVAKGILLGGTDNIGTRGGPRKMVASLFCRNAFVPPSVAGTLQTTPYNSEFADLDPDGNLKIDGLLTNVNGATPPLNCGDTIDNRPVLLLRTVVPANVANITPATPGSWFAAGILKSQSDDSSDKK